ncbi:MAG: oligosaccharide flippase family protein [Chloroflexota bacterium]|nr:oligosaccharide flippase family protein [Chloroflexota bacterium]
MSESLSKRSITSASWNIGASIITVAVLFVRSILLARMLPVDTFGVYAGASAIVGLTVILPNFGMGGAFLHRAPETENEDRAAAVHFSLKLVFLLVWAVLLGAAAWVFAENPLRTAILVLLIATFGMQLAETPRLILTRRVVHRRLALLQVLRALATTMVAIALAFRGADLWALLATDLTAMLLTLLVLYVWRPVWRPHLAWFSGVVDYYLRFGSRNFVAVALMKALDKIDDLWTGFYLGATALGFYSRAYTFAIYPRRFLAMPINLVAGGTYAELKNDRHRLSQAFFRTNAFLVRTGFLLAGLLLLVAPEFILLLLGEKWLPMLDAFRLMLVFTLLDPIKTTVGDVFIAVGRPEVLVRARTAQLVILLIGLFTLGATFGISGVALAVDAMLIAGMAILFWQARSHVDFSLRRMFAIPSLALVLGIAATFAVLSGLGIDNANWYTAILKTTAFSTTYLGILLLLERAQVLEMLAMLRQLWPGRSTG